jgi:hypothetical protein
MEVPARGASKIGEHSAEGRRVVVRTCRSADKPVSGGGERSPDLVIRLWEQLAKGASEGPGRDAFVVMVEPVDLRHLDHTTAIGCVNLTGCRGRLRRCLTRLRRRGSWRLSRA